MKLCGENEERHSGQTVAKLPNHRIDERFDLHFNIGGDR